MRFYLISHLIYGQKIQNPTELQKRNDLDIYRISASLADTKLLEVDKRKFIIPRSVKGGIGQNNVWFADRPESSEIVAGVLSLIKAGGDIDLPDVEGGYTLVSEFEGSLNPVEKQISRRYIYVGKREGQFFEIEP